MRLALAAGVRALPAAIAVIGLAAGVVKASRTRLWWLPAAIVAAFAALVAIECLILDTNDFSVIGVTAWTVAHALRYVAITLAVIAATALAAGFAMRRRHLRRRDPDA